VVEFGDLARWSSINEGFRLNINDLVITAKQIAPNKYSYSVMFSNDS
jgi:hypothetical protein